LGIGADIGLGSIAGLDSIYIVAEVVFNIPFKRAISGIGAFAGTFTSAFFLGRAFLG
jgi:hypothetical protein